MCVLMGCIDTICHCQRDLSVILQKCWLSTLIIVYTLLAVLKRIIICLWCQGEGETHELCIRSVLHSCGCRESTHMVHSLHSNWSGIYASIEECHFLVIRNGLIFVSCLRFPPLLLCLGLVDKGKMKVNSVRLSERGWTAGGPLGLSAGAVSMVALVLPLADVTRLLLYCLLSDSNKQEPVSGLSEPWCSCLNGRDFPTL